MTLHLTLSSGATVCVNDEGEGPLMVLISGLGGTAQFWEQQRRHFASRFRVISFDQPGCGEAPAMDGPVTIASLAQIAAEMTSRVAPGQTPAVLVGHSTGGAIAQKWISASYGPPPQRLVLSGTWARACAYMHSLFAFRIRSLGPDFSGDLGAYSELTKLLACDPADLMAPFTPAPSQIDIVRARTQVSRMRALVAFDGEKEAGQIDVPTFIIGAEDDRIVPVYHQRALGELIPNSMLEILPTGGHFFPQSRSDHFNEILTYWLNAASR